MNHVEKLTILSLGAGVQSSTLALMAAHGEIDPPDVAIFADTQWEPKAVYDWLDWLETQLPFPVYRVSHGNLREHLIAGTNSTGQRFSVVPFFTGNGGMGNRQCTNEYKIAPIQKKARELLGFKPRQRIPIGSVEMLIGISIDEAGRMKPSRERWITNRWPLIERRMSRSSCHEWMDKRGYPQPPKSSCLGCPFHADRQWLEIKANPEEWADTVRLDEIIRNHPKFNEQQYMHRSLKPLGEVDFSVLKNTLDMFINECEGMCGV